jgi:hemolysin activation/secretion protein
MGCNSSITNGGGMGHAGGAARSGLALLAGLCIGGQALAQASQPVVPRAEDLAPRQVVPPSTATLPDAAQRVPREIAKPEDDVRIEIRRFELDATAPQALREQLATLTSDLVGPDKGFEDLSNARLRITRYLQGELGYYLGYAYVPEQDFRDGVVRIAVLEGRLDKVILRWPEKDLPVRREVVQGYLDRLKEGSVLLVRDVERVVFLVNDLRGMRARFEVQPGSRPGTASLVVTPEAESVWSARADADVNGSRFLGAVRLSGLAQWNSPFGRGDGITANALVSTTRGLAFGLLGYTTPVGSDGIKLGATLSAVKYQLDKSIFPLDLNGTAVTTTAYGLYPVFRARNLNMFAVGTLEHKQYEDRQDAADSRSRKTVDTLSLGLTGDFRDAALGGGVNTYDAALVAGQLRYPDGRPGGLEDAPSFTKLTFGYSRLQDLLFIAPSLQDKHSGKVLAYVSLRGQLAFDNLDTTEQFRLGGPEGVRAFAPGEGTGDQGAVLSLEARLLPPESWFGRISNELVLSLFLDAGYVRYRHKLSANNPGNAPNTASFSGAGLGVSWVRPGEYALRLSVAAPLSGTPRSDTRERSARLYLLASKFFN